MGKSAIQEMPAHTPVGGRRRAGRCGRPLPPAQTAKSVQAFDPRGTVVQRIDNAYNEVFSVVELFIWSTIIHQDQSGTTRD
jgi:hypothetical protein